MLTPRPLFTLAAAGLLALAGLSRIPPAATSDRHPAVPHLPSATRGPVAIAFTPDGRRALVAESDEGALALLDTASGAVLTRYSTGGEGPAALAMAPDGTALVVNSFSGSLLALDSATGERRGFLHLPGEPQGVALSRDGRRAFISLAAVDAVVVVEVPQLREVGRISVGRRPGAMVLAPDGRTLLVANFRGGDVSLVDTASLREARRIALTGVNLRGIDIEPGGLRAYVTGQIPANSRVTAEPLDIWTNTVFTLDLRPEAISGSAEGWIDFSGAPSPDPDGLVVLGKERVAITLSGSDEALLVRTPGPHLRTYDPVIEKRQSVGAHPRGIALSPDRSQLWVANQLDSSLSVLDAETLRPLRRVELGAPSRPDPRLPGLYLFGSARLARGGQFSCNSCHPAGSTDGLTWEFSHVPDGLRPRNSRNLRGDLLRTAPFRWTGHEEALEDFLQDEIVGLLKGPAPDAATLAALRALIERLPMPPNPHRDPGGELTAQAARGRDLFEGKAGCVSCHAGALRGGTGRKEWIETTPPDVKLDVPHLRGVHDTSPYLHDGRAATLEEVLTRHNRENRHGGAHLLSPAELADLIRYLREL